MTRLINTFDGGTNGAAITTANSPIGGNGFDSVEIGSSTGATVLYDTTTIGGSDTAAKITTLTTASVARVGWTALPANVDVVYNVIYLYMPAAPTASFRIAQYLSAANTSCASIFITAGGLVQIGDASGGQAGANRTAGAVNTTGITRIETRIEMNTAGVPTIRLFKTSPLTSTTPDETKVGTASNFAGYASGYYFGVTSQTANVGPLYFAAVGLSDTDWLGPDRTPANTVQTVTLYQPTQHYAWGDTVTIAATVDDPDYHSTHTTSWSVLVKPTGSALTSSAATDIATFTPDVPGTYRVRATVDDGAGNVVSQDATFAVYASAFLKVAGVEVPARILI